MTGNSPDLDAAPPVLEMTGICKTFNAGLSSERRALVDVDLTLREGDFAVVIGSNGAGKSTLLSVVAGDVAPDGGSVLVDGADITDQAVHRRAAMIGRVFQDPARGTAPGLTVEENLALAYRRGQRRGLSLALTQRRRAQFHTAISRLGLDLEQRLDMRIDLLSGGQRQALSLIMATLSKPRILVLDEHCAALDPRTGDAVMAATVGAVGDSAITTLMVTHNMRHAIDYGNRLIMMNEGRILFEAEGAEKRALTIEALVQRFSVADDKLLLVR